MTLRCLAGVRPLVDRHEAHQPHQASDPLLIDEVVVIAQVPCHPLAVRVLPQPMSREADARRKTAFPGTACRSGASDRGSSHFRPSALSRTRVARSTATNITC